MYRYFRANSDNGIHFNSCNPAQPYEQFYKIYTLKKTLRINLTKFGTLPTKSVKFAIHLIVRGSPNKLNYIVLIKYLKTVRKTHKKSDKPKWGNHLSVMKTRMIYNRT